MAERVRPHRFHPLALTAAVATTSDPSWPSEIEATAASRSPQHG